MVLKRSQQVPAVAIKLHRGSRELRKNKPSPEESEGPRLNPAARQPVADYAWIRLETLVSGNKIEPSDITGRPGTPAKHASSRELWDAKTVAFHHLFLAIRVLHFLRLPKKCAEGS